MDTLGKGLFWLGFIVLIGVVFAYLIIIMAGSIALATTTTVLSISAVILIGALLMLMGRSYERRAERKREAKISSSLNNSNSK
ncbi:MAG: hypothetical protein NC339_08360 [Muribaculaceae bacterium]|nr:hypothetical protein [Muribaculaceae bacterium]